MLIHYERCYISAAVSLSNFTRYKAPPPLIQFTLLGNVTVQWIVIDKHMTGITSSITAYHDLSVQIKFRTRQTHMS
jgi:hypothetical protein